MSQTTYSIRHELHGEYLRADWRDVLTDPRGLSVTSSDPAVRAAYATQAEAEAVMWERHGRCPARLSVVRSADGAVLAECGRAAVPDPAIERARAELEAARAACPGAYESLQSVLRARR